MVNLGHWGGGEVYPDDEQHWRRQQARFLYPEKRDGGMCGSFAKRKKKGVQQRVIELRAGH
jgi:hypothetical protein